MTESAVRVRIAPSPTGDPHVGTAYVALFNYIFAKHNKGSFVLRIEDTDQTRSTPESETAILDSLRWLNLNWNEGPDVGGPYGPYRQSERTEIYREHADKLIESGHAYRCFCTPERLTEMRKVRGPRQTGYDRHCRHLTAEEQQEKLDSGISFVVRSAFPIEGETSWTEIRRGNITVPNTQVDDQILLKSDGFPTYHLANVVDDHLMKISHVVRAEEWINSTPKHLHLYKSFGWDPPQFVHLPLLRNADRTKISKRKNPVSLDFYRKAGYLPETMLNFLAMMGWTMPEGQEMFTPEEMIKAFSFERISLGGPVFDLKKLRWLNGLYIRELKSSALLSRIQQEVLSPDYLQNILPLIHKRIETLDEVVPFITMFCSGELHIDPELFIPKVAKKVAKRKNKPALTKEEIITELQEKYLWIHHVAEILDTVYNFTNEVLEARIRELAEEKELNVGRLFMVIRVAMTGTPATPPLFETMEVLGRVRIQRRFRESMAAITARLQECGAKPPSTKKKKKKKKKQ